MRAARTNLDAHTNKYNSDILVNAATEKRLNQDTLTSAETQKNTAEQTRGHAYRNDMLLLDSELAKTPAGTFYRHLRNLGPAVGGFMGGAAGGVLGRGLQRKGKKNDQPNLNTRPFAR